MGKFNMACINIIDHRNHSLDIKCDAVIETVNPQKKKSKESWIPDVTFVTRTNVSKVIHQAQLRVEDVCVCLYDWGSISKSEIREATKAQSRSD